MDEPVDMVRHRHTKRVDGHTSHAIWPEWPSLAALAVGPTLSKPYEACESRSLPLKVYKAQALKSRELRGSS